MLANETPAIIHCGREISVQDIEEIQEIVHLCGRLSRKELAKTISENLQWYTASGTNKVDACLKLLEKLDYKAF